HRLDQLPRYNSLTYRVWVKDHGDADMYYRLGVMFQKDDQSYPQKWTGWKHIGAGWHELVLDLTPEAADPTYQKVIKLFFRTYSPTGGYVDHYLDDIRLDYTTPG
ncbi:MAG: hypothetical protein ACRDT9_15445, partial [Agromyces sp.]